jgi:hypothetical protein
MSKSNAQRQRDYRERHLKGLGDEHDMLERINLMVSYSAKQSLQRLASCSGITQKAMLEKVLTETEQRLIDTLNGRQQDDYYDGKLSLRSNSEEEKSVRKD